MDCFTIFGQFVAFCDHHHNYDLVTMSLKNFENEVVIQ